jgi:hypothetical protein
MFHISFYFLCSEHKEKGKEHLVPGLKKKYSSLLYNLEQARQDNKRWVRHYTYISLTEFNITNVIKVIPELSSWWRQWWW